jgi:hypothetical protein
MLTPKRERNVANQSSCGLSPKLTFTCGLAMTPRSQSYRYGERGTQPAGCWPKNGITAAAANPEILPLEFLLGDDPVHGSLSGWIAEW